MDNLDLLLADLNLVDNLSKEDGIRKTRVS